MFKHTRALINTTKKELDTALSLFQFGIQIIYIAYLFYLVFTKGNSIWYLHLALLLICIPYLIFDLITTKNINGIKREKITLFGKKKHKERLSEAKQKRQNVVKIKFYVSHFIKLFVLASAFYPIIVSPDTVHPLSIMCTTAMVLLWIMQIVFEIIKLIFEGRVDLFMEALHADVEFITKPVNTVKNAFNKMVGREVAEEEPPTKERIYLDKLVEKSKNEKDAKRATEKAERSEKISSWLDSHLSRLSPKRRNDAPEETETKEPAAMNASETEVQDNNQV